MMNNWKTIESAPKDGTEVLTYSAAACIDMYRNSFYDEIEDCWMYYTSTCGMEGFDTIFEPTHWMPLPQPPKEK